MPTLQDIRAKEPALEGLDDTHAIEYLRRVHYPDMTAEDLGARLGVKPTAPADGSGLIRRLVGDTAVSAVKGAIGVPEAAVGLADLATGGRVGKFLENEGGAVGFRPKEANAALDAMYSPAQQAANKAVQTAANPEDGLGQRILDTGVAALQNPSTIAHSVIQSLPVMGAGGVIARGVIAAAPRAAGWAAAGIGEGMATAGQNAEQVRQETPDGLLTGKQALVMGASGALTGAISGIAAKVAGRLGIGDIDVMLQGGKNVSPQLQKGFVRQVLEGAFTEGVLEELPQSVQEQVAQNYALGKPLDEGVDQAVVMGTLSGGLMGGGAQLVRRQPEVGPLSRAANMAAGGVATLPPQAPTAPTAPAAPVAPVAPPEEGTHDRTKEVLLAHANERARVLEEKASGTKDQNMPGPDGKPVLVPGKPKEFLTPAEKAERDFLKEAGGDVEALARAYPAYAKALDEQHRAQDHEEALRRMERDAKLAENEAAGRSRAAADNEDLGVVSGAAPAAPDAPAAPVAPVAPELTDIPEAHQDDILNPQGKPFKERFNAMRKLANLPDKEQYQPVQVQGGYALRRVASDGKEATGVAAEPGGSVGAVTGGSAGDRVADGNGSVRGSGDDAAAPDGRSAPVQPVEDAGDASDPVTIGDVLDSDILNPQGGPFKEKAAAVAAQKKAGLGELVNVAGGWVVRQPTTLGKPGAETQPAGTRGTAAGDVLTVDDAAHGAATSPENDLSEPTDAQKKAGNYPKGHVVLNGLDLSIENPQGSVRSGKDRDGKEWSNTLQHHYGYIKGTVGNDKDHVDLFVKPETPLDYAGPVYVVDQVHPDTGKFDEHKALVGFASEQEARDAYAANYAEGWKGLKAITELPFDEFKTWVFDGPKNAPLAAESGTSAAPEPVDTPVDTGTDAGGQGVAEGSAPAGDGTPAPPAPDDTTGKGGGTITGGPTEPKAPKAEPKTPKEPKPELTADTPLKPSDVKRAIDTRDDETKAKFADADIKALAGVHHAISKSGDVLHFKRNAENPKNIEVGEGYATPTAEREHVASSAVAAQAAMARMVAGSDAAGVADAIYEGIRAVEPEDLPVILPEDHLIRLPVKAEEQAKIEAALKKAKFRISDRMKGDAADARITISAIHAPEKTSIGDAGEKMGGGRKEQFPPPPSPKDADEAAMERFLDALHPSKMLDAEESAEQTFGTLMFKEAIYSTARYPLAYIARRLRDNFGRLRYRGDGDKQLLMFALKSEEYQPKVAEYAEAYRTRLQGLAETIGSAQTVGATMTAFSEKYLEQGDTRWRWSDPSGVQLESVLDTSTSAITKWFGVFGEDENSTDQTNRVKKKDADKPPYLERVVRVGMKDHRQGRNVDENDFTAKFGFRGTEFGNWVTQDERQVNLNLAYDSMMDMADLLGMPPIHIGLMAKLGMAIGARGKGGRAAAHFEPGNNVINLTKTKGSGTTSHEWFHAFDHNLSGVQSDPDAVSPARALVNSLASALRTRTQYEKAESFLRSVLQDSAGSEDRNTPPKLAAVKSILSARYGRTAPMLADAITQTRFYSAAKSMDGDGKAYWATPVELLARGFETVLFDQTKGGSPYLVGPSRGDGVMSKKNGYQGTPYPTGEERQYVADVYEAFFDQIDPATLQIKPYKVEARVVDAAGQGFIVIDQHGMNPVQGSDGLKLIEKREDAQRIADVQSGQTRYLTIDKIMAGRMNLQAVDFLGRIDAVMEELGIIQWPEVKNGSMVEAMFFHLRQGWWPEDNAALLDYAAKAHRKESKELRGDRVVLKQAQEDFEAALARFAGQRIDDMRKTGADDRAIFDYFVDLYNKQPNLNVRSTTSMENQAYSTPLPIGFVAGLLGRVESSSVVVDATAGNGMLGITANPKKLIGIEIEKRRANNLRLMQRGRVIEGDATKLIDSELKSQEADVALLNPPFGSISPPVPVSSWDGNDYQLSKIDHLLVAKTMRAVADKGRATIIIGANREPGKLLRSDQIFLNWLYTNYNVADHFEIDGSLYKRMGAEWPLRVLVVAGRKQSENYYNMATPIERVMDYDQLWSRYEQAAQRSEEVVVGAGERSDGPRGGDQLGSGVPAGDRGQTGGADREGANAGSGDQSGGNGAGVRGGDDAGAAGNGGSTGGTAPGDNGPRGNGPGGQPNGGSGAGGSGNSGVGSGGSTGTGLGGLGGLTDEEIRRLLKQGSAGKSGTGVSKPPDDSPTPPKGGGGGGKKRGSKKASAPTDRVAGAAQHIRRILDDYDGGGKAVFSRDMNKDEAYARLWPHFEEIWDDIKATAREIGQAIRAFSARVGELFSDIADRLMPFMERFIGEKRDEAAARPPGKKPIIPDPLDSESQVIYRGRSTGFSGGIYVPRSMAQGLESAFSAFEAKHGDIDEFVANELGYASVKDMHEGPDGASRLGGYQVDALGLAISSMKAGNGFIIGDDTGVGKGRTAAGLIAWAVKQGKVPIFLSFKHELYSDMWGDLRDIGKQTEAIQMTNTDTVIVDKSNDNAPILRANSKESTAAMNHIITTGTMPSGKDVLFTTYSQVNGNAANHRRREAIKRLVLDGKAMFIMDESHNSAGESSTGEFFDSLLNGTGLFPGGTKSAPSTPPAGWTPPMVTYLSATFAKRADNLPIYGRTLLRYAGDGTPTSLRDIFQTGGDVLMRVASEMLVKAGAMIRRERSYEGVKFGFRVDEANAPRDGRLIDEVTSVLRQVVHADRAFDAWRKSSEGGLAILDYLGAKGYSVSNAASQTQAGVDKATFTSYVHNYIEQLLLSTKVKTIAEEVIASINRGEKPSIGVKSTMEAAIKDYQEQEGIKVGDEMPDFGWQAVLARAERSSRRVTLKPPNSNSPRDYIKVIIPHEIMPGTLQREYARATDLISRFKSELPASPIDALAHELGQFFIVTGDDGKITATKTPPAGAKSRPLVFADISGKGVMVDYAGKVPVLRTVTGRNNNRTVTGYQDGKIDVVLITAAGSTGLSLHSSEKALDQRPRFMVIGQSDADISVFKQKLGRIHRTGQVEWPGFMVLATGIPAERRPLAVLRKKLKKMFSATSAGSSATDIEAVDFINMYGDRIVWEFLKDNADMAMFFNFDMTRDMPVDVSLSASGRAALLPVAQQEEFFDEVERGFTQEIEERNATGTNELERRELDLQAEQISEAVLDPGMDEGNPFTAAAMLSKFNVNIIGDIPTPDKVRAAVAQALAGRTMDAVVDEIEKSLKVAYDEALNQEALAIAGFEKERDDPKTTESRKHQLIDQIDARQKKLRQVPEVKAATLDALRRRFKIGAQFNSVKFGDVDTQGVVVSVKVSASATKRGNPYSPSNFTIGLIRNVPNGRISFPLSAIMHNDPGKEKYVGGATSWRDEIDEWFSLRNAVGGREVRYIAHGNLLTAKRILPAVPRGEIVKFTWEGKSDPVDGILMAQSFAPDQNAATQEAIRYPDAAADYMLSLLAAQAEKDASRDSFYQDRLEAILAEVVHREPVPEDILDDLKSAGISGAEGKWFLRIGYGNRINFFVRPSGRSIVKLLKPIIGDMSNRGGSDFTLNNSSVLEDPAVLRSLIRQLGKAGPITVDIDAGPVVRPIVRKHYEADIGKSGGDAPAASRTSDGTIHPERRADAVQATASNIASRWKSAPPIVVARSMDDPKIPEAIRKEGRKLQSAGAAGAPNGFFDPATGTVYLIADKLGSDADVVRVLMHESLGHYGMRATFGAEFGAMLDRMAVLNSGKVRTAAKRLGYDFDKQSERRLAAEEVLAYMAQNTPSLGWVKRAVAAIRSWARANLPGFAKLKLSDAELIRDFILPARRYVEGGPDGPKGGNVATPAVFSRDLGAALMAGADRARDVPLLAGYKLGDLMDGGGKLSWWHKTVGMQYHLAQKSPPFKRVFDAVQRFLADATFYAAEAADKAPTILPKLDKATDALPAMTLFGKHVGKSALSAADTKALAAPVFEGTLTWGRDEQGRARPISELEEELGAVALDDKAHKLMRAKLIAPEVLRMWQGLPMEQYEKIIEGKFEREFLKPGVVFTPAELKEHFGSTDAQIGHYKEFRSAIDKSLHDLAISEMVNHAGADALAIREQVMATGDLDSAAVMLRDHLFSLALADPDRQALMARAAAVRQSATDMPTDAKDRAKRMAALVEKAENLEAEAEAVKRVVVLNAAGNKMIEIADHAKDMMARGYAPLSRFGTYTLEATTADGERYFGMFDTDSARNKARRLLVKAGATIVESGTGTMSQEKYKLFNGISPETAALFGEMLGLDSHGDAERDIAFQEYVKRAVANRSAMKRLLQRKGIAGFSDDAGRVLASFVVSNGRKTSSNLHTKELAEAVNDIPKSQGELADAAEKLREYVRNPQEEAQGFRALMFAQYIGGSIASAMLNATQPLTMTFPYLSQFGGAAKAGQRLLGAARDATRDTTGDATLDAALKRAEEEGTVSPQEIHSLQAQAMGKAHLKSGDGTKLGDATAKANNALSKLSLAWGKVFGVAEQFNRRITFIAAYRTAVEQGIAHPDQFAKKAVDETQGVYNKGNKPRWARGAVGSILFTFKQYSVNYVELLERMATAGEPGSPERAAGRKAALLALAVLFLMAGADGLPFAEDMQDVIDGAMQRLGYNFSSKQKMREVLTAALTKDGAELVMGGVSTLPGMPIDFSGRTSMGNMIPGTGLLQKKADHTRDVVELAGPAGDLVKRGFSAGEQALAGDVLGAATTVLPTAGRNVVKAADMAQTGMYRDDKWRKVVDTTPGEAIGKAIGFQPQSVAAISEAGYEVEREKAAYRLASSEINAKMAKGMFDGDDALRQEARDDLANWNARNPDQPMKLNMPSILHRVRDMRKSKEQRIADTAPKAIRAQVRAQLAEAKS